MASQMNSQVHHQSNVRLSFISVAVLATVFCLIGTEAFAVSARVKIACAKDYLAHCRQHAPGSPGVRKCMRAVGDNLSPRCVNALMAAGEVSEKEVAEHSSR